MSEEPKSKFSLNGLLVALLLMPVLYVLSVGPAARITLSYSSGHRWFGVFYLPLEWVYQHQPVARKPLEAYLRLWGVK